MEREMREVAVEINAIFDNMSLDLLDKIPKEIKRFFKENASNTYVFNYDFTKSLTEQNLKHKTKGIIAWLYRDYICDEYERKEYIKEYNKYVYEKELEKKKIYNQNNLFANKTKYPNS